MSIHKNQNIFARFSFTVAHKMKKREKNAESVE